MEINASNAKDRLHTSTSSNLSVLRAKETNCISLMNSFALNALWELRQFKKEVSVLQFQVPPISKPSTEFCFLKIQTLLITGLIKL
jgi:hypothetical protein